MPSHRCPNIPFPVAVSADSIYYPTVSGSLPASSDAASICFHVQFVGASQLWQCSNAMGLSTLHGTVTPASGITLNAPYCCNADTVKCYRSFVGVRLPANNPMVTALSGTLRTQAQSQSSSIVCYRAVPRSPGTYNLTVTSQPDDSLLVTVPLVVVLGQPCVGNK